MFHLLYFICKYIDNYIFCIPPYNILKNFLRFFKENLPYLFTLYVPKVKH